MNEKAEEVRGFVHNSIADWADLYTALSNRGVTYMRMLRMTDEQLIQIARGHTKDLPKRSGQAWATDEVLTRVSLQETVIVRFEGDDATKKVMVLLDKQSGKFIGPWLTPSPNVS